MNYRKDSLRNVLLESGLHRYIVSIDRGDHNPVYLYTWGYSKARPTVDVDFMADRISRDRDFLAHAFQALLLSDIPSVNIHAYSLETVVAEKFHTMIDRDVLNSRMKDFFDCYQLLTKRNLDDDMLYEAIKATFDNRELTYNSDLQLFADNFITDEARIIRWKAFLRKIQWKDPLEFETVMKVIKDRLQPMAEKYFYINTT